MSPGEFLTIVLLLVLAFAAIALLFIRQIFISTLALLIVLLDLGVLYLLLMSEFIGVVQILLYAGGIVVLVLFALMLTTKKISGPFDIEFHHKVPGYLTGIGMFTILALAIFQQSWQPGNTSIASLQTIGRDLLTTHVLAFELSGIILLLTLAGASVLASTLKNNSKR